MTSGTAEYFEGRKSRVESRSEVVREGELKLVIDDLKKAAVTRGTAVYFQSRK